MINLLQELHKQRFIHRDLKLSNFTIGRKEKNNKIYLIDFGLGKKYMDRDKNHINFKEQKKFVGNVKYCSLNCHQLYEQSRRDDLESVCYIMMHMVKGTLPWLNIKASNKEEKYEKIHKIKMKNNND
jgi:serine/threonine protein kinase